MMASAQFEKFLKLLWASKGPEGPIDLDAMRQTMDRVGGKLPEGVTGTPSQLGGVPGEWIEAEGADTDRAVLFLHGGGYVAGSVDSHRNLTGSLAKATGMRVFALDYRLAPEHPHPAQVDDAVAAYRALLEEGMDPARLAVVGDSAGGGLTVAMLLALRDAGDPLPAAAVPISPLFDLEATGESMRTRVDVDPMVTPDSLSQMARLFVGEHGDLADPLASPLRADVAGLPPLLIQVGDAEVLLDDSIRMAARIEAAGGDVTLEVWPEMVHVWHASAGFVPESDQAIARIAEYLSERQAG
jgi:epsilon-lactone hydrolase